MRIFDKAMLVDTHAHIPLIINMSSLDVTTADSMLVHTMLQEAQQKNVRQIVTIGTMYSDSMQNVALARAFTDVYATIGIHPTEITEQFAEHIAIFRALITRENAAHNKIVAIGECGVDLYHKKSSLVEQQDVFRVQIELALEHDLSVVIHSRDAADETLRCLDEFKDSKLRGVIHCFSYDSSIAREFLQRGFVLGIGGTVTYPKNELLRDIMRQITLDDFILETDAPFLAPQPWRGKKNHPQYVAYLAEYIAELRATTTEEVATATTRTAQKIFALVS